jgi:hypothetical protein
MFAMILLIAVTTGSYDGSVSVVWVHTTPVVYVVASMFKLELHPFVCAESIPF